MKRPFIFLSIGFILGIIISYSFKINIEFLLFFLLLFLITYIFLKNSEINIGIFFMMFFLGVLIFSINEYQDNKDIESFSNREFEITGYIKNIDKIDEEYNRYIFKVDSPMNENIILTIGKDSNFDISDKLKINTILKEPEENTNPKLFNYKLYLKSKNINFKAYVDGDKVKKIGENSNLFVKIKKSFNNTVDDSLEILKPRNRDLIKSMILGRSNIMEEEDIDSFRNLGLAHILAVSGLHLGIITGFLILIMSALTMDRKLINLISILFIIIYIFLIGGPPSILRAGISLIIYFLSINLKKYSDPVNNLFFISFILSIYNPYIIFNIGFQLSFIATLSILIIPRYIKRFVKTKNNLSALTSIIAVQIGLFPIQIYYFNYFNLLSIVGNLLIIPIISIVLPLGFVLVLLNIKLYFIGYSIATIIDIFLDIVFKINEILINIKLFEFKIFSPNIFLIIFYYLILGIIFRKIKINFLSKNINKFIIFFILIIIIFNSFNIFYENSLSVEFIDVDQGDCSLIRYKNKNYLIDTGGNTFKNFDIGKNIVIPYLIKTGVTDLDTVFISHFDDDHSKSLVDIMDEIKINRLVFGYINSENKLYQDIKTKAEKLNIPIEILNTGDKLYIDKNIFFKVYNPNKKIKDINLSENDMSLVLELNYFDKNILFTGDIEENSENKLIENNISEVNFLKVPHHGSKTSSSEELLNKIKPKVGFIQVGKNNNFSHPNKEVLNRYKEHHTEIYRTDISGLINLHLTEKNCIIKEFIKEKYSIIEFVIYNSYDIIIYLIDIIIIYISIKIYLGNEELDSIELHRFL